MKLLSKKFFEYYSTDQYRLMEDTSTYVLFQGTNTEIRIFVSYNQENDTHTLLCFSNGGDIADFTNTLKKWKENPHIRVKNIFEPIQINVVNLGNLLTTTESEIFHLYYVHKLPYAKIMEKVGMNSTKAIDNAIQRIRAKLRNF